MDIWYIKEADKAVINIGPHDISMLYIINYLFCNKYRNPHIC